MANKKWVNPQYTPPLTDKQLHCLVIMLEKNKAEDVEAFYAKRKGAQ